MELGKFILTEKETPSKLGRRFVFSQESEFACTKDKAYSNDKADSRDFFPVLVPDICSNLWPPLFLAAVLQTDC